MLIIYEPCLSTSVTLTLTLSLHFAPLVYIGYCIESWEATGHVGRPEWSKDWYVHTAVSGENMHCIIIKTINVARKNTVEARVIKLISKEQLLHVMTLNFSWKMYTLPWIGAGHSLEDLECGMSEMLLHMMHNACNVWHGFSGLDTLLMTWIGNVTLMMCFDTNTEPLEFIMNIVFGHYMRMKLEENWNGATERWITFCCLWFSMLWTSIILIFCTWDAVINWDPTDAVLKDSTIWGNGSKWPCYCDCLWQHG